MTTAQLIEIAKMSEAQFLHELQSSRNGLTSNISHQKLKTEGANVLKQEPKTHVLFQFLDRFKDPLMLVLIMVAFI